jgi:hypothetical protein
MRASRLPVRLAVPGLLVPALVGLPALSASAAAPSGAATYRDACGDAEGSPLDLESLALDGRASTAAWTLTITSCTPWEADDLGAEGSVDIPVAVPGGRGDGADYALFVTRSGAGALELTAVRTPTDADYDGWEVTSSSTMARPDARSAVAVLPYAALGSPDSIDFVASSLDAEGREDLLPEDGADVLQWPVGSAQPVPGVSTPPAPAPPSPTPSGATDAACPPGLVPEDGFTDVPDASTHEANVDCVVWWQVSTGTPHGYAPLVGVTRAQMASFLARLIERSGGELPAQPADAFSDDDGSVHELRINQLAALGVAGGRGGGRFAPQDPVDRAQMATFLTRAFEARTGTALPPAEDRFPDDATSVHQDRINQAAAAGFTSGTGDGGYAPFAPVRRDGMATFLARVLNRLVVEGLASPPSTG